MKNKCARTSIETENSVIRHLFAVAFAAAALSGCASVDGTSTSTCGATGADTACTGQGAVRGIVQDGLVAFKGIPYAAAPVGQLRFRPPAAPLTWQGVRDASAFGPVCPQLDGKEVIGNEDCLTLNIWKPKQASTGALPVMVFLTGGGNHAFSGQGSPGFGGVKYNGEKLVPEGVVYVSFNARLGALGYLAHPALDAEHSKNVSGNYGSLDHIAMLKWLRQNIASFGGDPKRIFLFGTSAGGGNLCALMTSPQARGLFHGAAMQSSVPTGCEMQTLADAEQGTGQRIAQLTGCDQAGTRAGNKADDRLADIAACLRGKSMKDIVRALPGTFGVLPRLYGPNVDGHVFPRQPIEIIRERGHSAMPVIVGNSTEETMLFVNAVGPVTDATSYAAGIEKVFGSSNAAAIASRYPLQAYPTPRAAFVSLTTDALFTCQSRRVARTLTEAGNPPVYRYLFAHALQNDAQQKALGAVHTIEHAFLFPWQGSYRPTGDDLKIQNAMIAYWSAMARTGAPGSAGGVAWQPSTKAQDAYLEIAPALSMKSGAQDAHCDFWDGVKLPWPHL
ncbi:carboxylesterase family protein [Noviherbaspirillum sp. CPCC 100848]|uniref:Carboxylic ester hydrolase n=1 Tax=Noviherbaspirillum album TaxID=3080276 RepID=A0ABU6JH73_9BURK|nr:carboxylesterase family protein [Noviherbaspirillum sp. CPCC 100848]MEC4722444.1 carboxylesterase family protein [Noviherbaspirillum sp. CPCC 100848]